MAVLTVAVLTVAGIAKRFGDVQVLNSISFVINHGEKVGLVGANGVGKSTLFKIVIGELEADSGAIARGAGVSFGYLAQALELDPAQTVAQMVDGARGNLDALQERLRTLESALSSPGDHAALLAEYAQASDLFERRGGYAGFEVDQVLAGLGLGGLDRGRSVASLSGGEKTRLGIAALLLTSPDLLLLDEPTNHLDFEALGWLEDHLARWQGALLVISHDRHFLDRTVSQIVVIDEHSHESTIYAGNYSAYAAAREQARARWSIDYEAQQEEIRELRRIVRTRGRQVAHNRPPTDGDGFYYAFKAGRVDATVARNVHAAEEKLRRIEEDPIPKPPRPLAINPAFNPALFGSKTPLAFDDVSKAFGQRVLLDGVSAAIAARARIVIVSPNGSGKSTLLRILAGLLASDAGAVTRAPGVEIGYLDQEQGTISTGMTVYEAFAAGMTGDFESLKTELLSTGLFTWPELNRRTEVLSAGQKRKLQIARLLATRANILLLDEPTNHISLDVLEQFEQALLEFAGPIVAVSHDRRFIERFGEERWEIAGGHLRRTLRVRPSSI